MKLGDSEIPMRKDLDQKTMKKINYIAASNGELNPIMIKFIKEQVDRMGTMIKRAQWFGPKILDFPRKLFLLLATGHTHVYGD